MKTSPLMGPSKDEVSIGCSNKAINLSKNITVNSFVVSAEPARVQAKLEFDLEVQKLEYQWNTNIIDSAGLKLRVDNYLLKEGPSSKLFKSLNQLFIMKLFCKLISLYFSTSYIGS